MPSKWTKDKPTLQGIYWYRPTKDEKKDKEMGLKAVEVTHVFEMEVKNNPPVMIADFMRYLTGVEKLQGEWQGPIFPEA